MNGQKATKTSSSVPGFRRPLDHSSTEPEDSVPRAEVGHRAIRGVEREPGLIRGQRGFERNEQRAVPRLQAVLRLVGAPFSCVVLTGLAQRIAMKKARHRIEIVFLAGEGKEARNIINQGCRGEIRGVAGKPFLQPKQRLCLTRILFLLHRALGVFAKVRETAGVESNLRHDQIHTRHPRIGGARTLGQGKSVLGALLESRRVGLVQEIERSRTRRRIRGRGRLRLSVFGGAAESVARTTELVAADKGQSDGREHADGSPGLKPPATAPGRAAGALAGRPARWHGPNL